MNQRRKKIIMKDKKTGLIQTLIGAIILVIGIVLCVNTYIVKGNKAYAFSLLVTILGIVILIAGLYRTFSKKERKPVDAKVIAQAALCAALCYVGATFIKIDIPVGTERTMFHFGNVFSRSCSFTYRWRMGWSCREQSA